MRVHPAAGLVECDRAPCPVAAGRLSPRRLGRRDRDGPARPVRPLRRRHVLVGRPHAGRPGDAVAAPGRRGHRTPTGYGPGAGWVLDRADAMAGLRDDVSGFPSRRRRPPAGRASWPASTVASGCRPPGGSSPGCCGRSSSRRSPARRPTGRTRRPSATSASRRPGPVTALWLPPDPAGVAAAPYWVFHPFGVEQRRADTLRRAAAEAGRLERCADSAEATERLTAIRRHRPVDGGRGGPHRVRRRRRGQRRRLPHPQHGGLGAGRRGARHRRPDARAAGAVPGPPGPGVHAARGRPASARRSSARACRSARSRSSSGPAGFQPVSGPACAGCGRAGRRTATGRPARAARRAASARWRAG